MLHPMYHTTARLNSSSTSLTRNLPLPLTKFFPTPQKGRLLYRGMPRTSPHTHRLQLSISLPTKPFSNTSFSTQTRYLLYGGMPRARCFTRHLQLSTLHILILRHIIYSITRSFGLDLSLYGGTPTTHQRLLQTHNFLTSTLWTTARHATTNACTRVIQAVH